MIEFLSSWAKNIGLSIIVISILEMILPNNKTKKYVKVIFGIYIIFNIISPFIKNADTLNVSNFDFEEYGNYVTDNNNSNSVSINDRIENMYIEELEKDITTKVNNLGYEVISCNVETTPISNEEEVVIKKIELELISKTKEEQEETVEDKLVKEIQKIKPINTTIKSENTISDKQNQNSLNNTQLQEIKKFLIEEYGVDEKCLKIN